MSESKFNWESALVGAFLTLIVSVAGGWILLRMQTKNPNLLYSSTGTIPFEGQDEIIGIYYVLITNSGEKEAKEVNCHIGVETASIKEWKISIDPAIQYSNSSDSESISLDIPTLNPTEQIEVYILASTTTTLPEKVSVSLRGEGIIGSGGTASEKVSLFARARKLRGIIILKSSEGCYHVVFNRLVDWTENMSIVAWVAELSHNPGLQKWHRMQCIKVGSTLRVSPKGEKAPPRIVFREGEEDKQIHEFLKFRKLIKKSIRAN